MKQFTTSTFLLIISTAIFYTLGALIYHTHLPLDMLRFVTANDWSVDYEDAQIERLATDTSTTQPDSIHSRPITKMKLVVQVKNSVTKPLSVDSLRVFQLSTGRTLPLVAFQRNYDEPSNITISNSIGIWIWKPATLRTLMTFPNPFYEYVRDSVWRIDSRKDTISQSLFAGKDVAIGVYTNRGRKIVPLLRYVVRRRGM